MWFDFWKHPRIGNTSGSRERERERLDELVLRLMPTQRDPAKASAQASAYHRAVRTLNRDLADAAMSDQAGGRRVCRNYRLQPRLNGEWIENLAPVVPAREVLCEEIVIFAILVRLTDRECRCTGPQMPGYHRLSHRFEAFTLRSSSRLAMVGWRSKDVPATLNTDV